MRISINLLPPEITKRELKQANFYKIQFAGIAVILTMIFLASLTVALRILQSRNIDVVQKNLDQAQQRVTDLKSTQVSLFLLKNRLSIIDKYWGISSAQSSTYQLIDKLIPSSIAINAITIDKAGEAILTALVPDAVGLDNLVDSLTVNENNEGKISQVSIESLSRDKDSFYRISFKIKPK